jgi:DNA-binding PadR family transcriptional regulator
VSLKSRHTDESSRSRGQHCAPFAHGPHESRFHHHGGGGPHGRGFGPFGRAKRGNVRASVLAVLVERPMHGYEIMQQLEELTGGMWRPSPGSVYPTLQLLEDQGLVKADEVEGKRIFSLTETGTAEVTANEERMGGAPWAAPGHGAGGAHMKLRSSVGHLIAAVRQVGIAGSAEQVDKALEILTEARKRIYALLAEGE